MAVSVAGTRVTFTPPPGAQGLIGDFTDWTKRPPLPVTGGAAITLTLPRHSWTEYAWIGADGQAFADPDNPRKSLNPWWPYPRAAEVGEYPQHPLWQGEAPADPAQRGEAHRLAWDGRVFPGKRRGYVYTPPHYDQSQRYPVYYVQEGVAFSRTGKLGELHDRALARQQIAPAVLVFAEPQDRNQEYYLSDRYFDFLQEEVLPQVEAQYAVRRDAAGRGLWGASLGGLISLYTAWQHPESFGRVASHSAALIASPQGKGPQINTTTAGEWLREQFLQRPPQTLRLSLDTGTLEWLLAPNRRMAAALQDLGTAHQYREYASGHNWVTWRQALPEALLYLQEQGEDRVRTL